MVTWVNAHGPGASAATRKKTQDFTLFIEVLKKTTKLDEYPMRQTYRLLASYNSELSMPKCN